MTDTGFDLEKTLGRIRKLLAIAEDAHSNNANEAAAAAAMAENLMRKFNIDHADVLRAAIKNKTAHFSIAKCRANMKRDDPKRPALLKNPSWAGWLGVAVAKLHDCDVRFANDELGACVAFQGFATDVQVAAWTFDYLVGALIRGCQAYQKAALRTKAESESFRRGFVLELTAALRAELRAKEAEMAGAVASTALVVSKAQALAEHFGVVNYRTSKTALVVRSGDAYAAGRAAGAQVAVGRKGIGSSSRHVALL